MLNRILVILVVIGLSLAAYVRWSPVEPTMWHVMPEVSGVGDVSSYNGHIAARQITTTPEGVLSALDRTILAAPRTKRIAGDVEAGMLTYEIRSAVLAFPDFVTVAISDDRLLVIQGRSQFGGDQGGNAERIALWLDNLGPLVVPPS